MSLIMSFTSSASYSMSGVCNGPSCHVPAHIAAAPRHPNRASTATVDARDTGRDVGASHAHHRGSTGLRVARARGRCLRRAILVVEVMLAALLPVRPAVADRLVVHQRGLVGGFRQFLGLGRKLR